MNKITFRTAGAILAAGTAALWAVPALADHQVVYAPRTDAFASSQAHQGPNVAGSTIHVVNGATTDSSVSGGGGVNGGGGPNYSYTTAFQDGGNGNIALHSDSSASASLGEGRLRATVGATGPSNFGSPAGFASARLDDTLFFTNTTAGDLAVSFTYAFDGRLIDPNESNPGGDVSLMLGCDGYLCYNSANQAIRFAGTGAQAGGNMNYYFYDDTASYFGDNIYGGANPNFQTGLGALDGVGGNVVGWITANLLIPTGQTSLGIRGVLDLDCRGGSSCDFGHTGQFSFGALPTGLTYGSASGVFLTAAVTPPQPGAVPEPASWALMIAGFGLVGGAMRRRRPMPALA